MHCFAVVIIGEWERGVFLGDYSAYYSLVDKSLNAIP